MAGRFDALVVDEGQDVSADWWLPLQLLLTDPDRSPLRSLPQLRLAAPLWSSATVANDKQGWRCPTARRNGWPRGSPRDRKE